MFVVVLFVVLCLILRCFAGEDQGSCDNLGPQAFQSPTHTCGSNRPLLAALCDDSVHWSGENTFAD